MNKKSDSKQNFHSKFLSGTISKNESEAKNNAIPKKNYYVLLTAANRKLNKKLQKSTK
jgi:hypothetical protein